MPKLILQMTASVPIREFSSECHGVHCSVLYALLTTSLKRNAYFCKMSISKRFYMNVSSKGEANFWASQEHTPGARNQQCRPAPAWCSAERSSSANATTTAELAAGATQGGMHRRGPRVGAPLPLKRGYTSRNIWETAGNRA